MIYKYLYIGCISAFVLFFSAPAFANGLLDGPYVGVKAGRDSYRDVYSYTYDDGTDVQTFTLDGIGTAGFSGTLFAGYDLEVNRSHFAVEGEYGFGSTDFNVDFNINGNMANYDVEIRNTFGVSARYGYEVLRNAMIYGSGGWVRTRYHISDSFYGQSRSENIDGWRFGGGIELALSRRVSLRAEYLYTDYKNQTTVYSNVESDQESITADSFNLGLAVRF